MRESDKALAKLSNLSNSMRARSQGGKKDAGPRPVLSRTNIAEGNTSSTSVGNSFTYDSLDPKSFG